MPELKICGVTNVRDARLCADEGADYVGLIFARVSPRCVTPAAARRIVKALPRSVLPVAVFMNQDLAEVRDILKVTGIPIAQLHGSESPEYARALGTRVIKVFDTFSKRSLSRLTRYDVFAYLLDLPKFEQADDHVDVQFALNAKNYGNVFLSGKLDRHNVGDLIRRVRPFGVDVCSATESAPGKKDRGRLRAFVEAVRKAAREVPIARV